MTSEIPGTCAPRVLDATATIQTGETGVLLAVIDPADLHLYPDRGFSRLAAHTAIEALQLITYAKPQVVAVDWDMPRIDGAAICEAALKAGCHSVLLKPVTRGLVATRVGRLVAALANGGSNGSNTIHANGTNLAWPDTACPQCSVPGAISFEFLSHRRA
jgi:hypothetical protein